MVHTFQKLLGEENDNKKIPLIHWSPFKNEKKKGGETEESKMVKGWGR